MGIGVTMVILTAGIDLSTGSMMALVGMTMANIYRYTLWPIWLMILAGIAVGALAGLFNGMIITRLNLPEFIATLSTMSMYRALTYIISIKQNGLITSQALKAQSFIKLGKSVEASTTSSSFVVLALIGQIILKYTVTEPTSTQWVPTSKQPDFPVSIQGQDQMPGLRHHRLLHRYRGSVRPARLQSTTALLGDGMEFNVIAAVVVGGCSLAGGRGDIIGTLIGAVFMAALDNGIYKFRLTQLIS